MTQTTSTDEELARQARDGDESAVEVLFERWAPRMRERVRRSLRGIVRRRIAESDVIQDAWLAAFLRFEDFEDRGEGSFGRWLQKILENKLKEALRRHLGTGKRDARCEVTRGDGSGDRSAPDRARSPSVEAVVTEDCAALRRAMAELPEHYRAILRMVHEQDLSLTEIGRRTGRSANAACKVYGRAVTALGDLLGGDAR